MPENNLKKGKVVLGDESMVVWYEIYPESEGVTMGRFEYYNPPPLGIHAAMKAKGTMTLSAGKNVHEIEITEQVVLSRKMKFILKPPTEHILSTPRTASDR